jgi:YD repeat-containing protein
VLRVGTTNGGATAARTLLTFEGAAGYVTEAHLNLWASSTVSCSPAAVNLFGVVPAAEKGFSEADMVWSDQPALDGFGLVSTTQVAKGATGCAAGWVSFDATTLVRRRSRTTPAEITIGLRAADETNNNTWLAFQSREGGANDPELWYTIENGPTATSPISPTDGLRLDDTSAVQLQVNGSTDGDGDPITYRFRVTTNPDGRTGAVLHSGWQTGTTWTIPAGVLQDGVTYYWNALSSDGIAITEPNWARSIRVDRRTGRDATMPFDNYGPVGVNLTSGNLNLSTGSRTFPAVGGPIGVSFTYDSRTLPAPGLVGTYYDDVDADRVFDTTEAAQLVRRDAQISFDWENGSPAPAVQSDNFLARWSGVVSVPTTGSYQFGALAGGGARIWVNSTLVVDEWTDQAPTTPVYGSSVSLTAGQSVSLVVEYFAGAQPASMQLWVKNAVPEAVVPASWLSATIPGLPTGWRLSADTAGAFVRADILDGAVIVHDAAGVPHTFALRNGYYVAPSDLPEAVLARDEQGFLTLHSGGITSVFGAAGNVVSATMGADDRRPAAPTYSWTGTASRLEAITDPVSTMALRIRYAGDTACPTNPPSGFDTATPPGMICALDYDWDSTRTSLWYVGGRLARIEDPGGLITDFGYDSSNRVISIRTPLAADAIAAGVRADDATTRTEITYDTSQRVSSVTLPAPTTGAARLPTRTRTATATRTSWSTA